MPAPRPTTATFGATAKARGPISRYRWIGSRTETSLAKPNGSRRGSDPGLAAVGFPTGLPRTHPPPGRRGIIRQPGTLCARSQAAKQRLWTGRPLGGAPSRIRTCDLRIRSPTLYPTELWARPAARPIGRPTGRKEWRRGRDSNPGPGSTPGNRLAGGCHRPTRPPLRAQRSIFPAGPGFVNSAGGSGTSGGGGGIRTPEGLHPYRFSRPAPSTARPPLRSSPDADLLARRSVYGSTLC